MYCLYVILQVSVFVDLVLSVDVVHSKSRFLQTGINGNPPVVEPVPKVRVYVYNPPNTFNPDNELFSKRILRNLEEESRRNEDILLDNKAAEEHEFQRKQLSRILGNSINNLWVK
ncbi:signal peptide containing protein [Theileria equi strain WA]|uniref:Signal peptide containing protein n=1 Tax=Theileria equi strain WA TaxID=1537102 RepID=L1LDC4_THEEQ|nr:signal peptide containing protein [Theileria equi strain WA]EKX73178.1 signal peptide containing protein [Theileria equi strain WA]|eukprot:XP_004832630.1 signal peptide containing protein [Theileria equi strain WA]